MDPNAIPLPDACRAVGISEKTGQRLVARWPWLAMGLRKNPRGKPTALVVPQLLASRSPVSGHKHASQLRFRRNCALRGVSANLTLQILMEGCRPDLDKLRAGIGLISLGNAFDFIEMLHGKESPGSKPFIARLARSIRTGAGDVEECDDALSDLWRKSWKEAHRWEVAASMPIFISDFKYKPTRGFLSMRPDYLNQPGWPSPGGRELGFNQSLQRVRWRQNIVGSPAELGRFADAIHASKENLETFKVCVAMAAQVTRKRVGAVVGWEYEEVAQAIDSLGELCGKRIATRFLDAWFRRCQRDRIRDEQGRKPAGKVTRAMVNRAFHMSRSA